jgi:hypothetical protein
MGWADFMKVDIRQRSFNYVKWINLGTDVLRAIHNTIIVLYAMMPYTLVDKQQS